VAQGVLVIETVLWMLAVRLGAVLSLFAVLLTVIWGVIAVAVSPEWWLLILIFAGLFACAAFAVIWLGVFIAYVIGYGARVLGGS
jgi:hypothetical protein